MYVCIPRITIFQLTLSTAQTGAKGACPQLKTDIVELKSANAKRPPSPPDPLYMTQLARPSRFPRYFEVCFSFSTLRLHQAISIHFSRLRSAFDRSAVHRVSLPPLTFSPYLWESYV